MYLKYNTYIIKYKFKKCNIFTKKNPFPTNNNASCMMKRKQFFVMIINYKFIIIGKDTETPCSLSLYYILILDDPTKYYCKYTSSFYIN